MTHSKNPPKIILIGAGIMSATLATMLRKLEPTWQIVVLERLDRAAAESSEAMNNAGTGHSAFCELNYTPELPDGSIDISKAIKIASSFEFSKEFWAHLVREKWLKKPADFIRRTPHVSFVWGEKNVNFLRKRFETLTRQPLFDGMEFSDDPAKIAEWAPLVIEGRPRNEKVAATRMAIGTDVDFGALASGIFDYLNRQKGFEMRLETEVRDLQKLENGAWRVAFQNLKSGEKGQLEADFVFIGAGGGALHLLQKADIKEAEGYGGFPISGQWLVCKNDEIIARHNAKVYGKASVGAPPMSVPHLDTRIVDGKKALLFGPFAGFSTKFLKNGSFWDLPESLEIDNLLPMLAAGWHNFSLTKYLVDQIRQSPEDRMAALRAYFPNAKTEDWELAIAGQRVQVIKPDDEEIGILEFGTELVAASDCSLAALLGASPGASTAFSAMREVLEKCFAEKMATAEWKKGLRKMAPSFGKWIVKDNRCRFSREVRQRPLGLFD